MGLSAIGSFWHNPIPHHVVSVGGQKDPAVNRDTLFRLTKLVEAKDNMTAAHTWRVALYTQALAEEMAFDPPVVRRMIRGAALHDLGKIDVPTRILNKPGALSDEEFAVIRRHPVLGHKRLIDMGETDDIVLDLVRCHHERLDGSGYPDGLRGEAIPQVARMFAVVDSFDAMTSIRPYRRSDDPTGVRHALDDLNRYAGIWYCPESVECFTLLFASGKVTWIHEHYNDTQALRHLDSPLSVEEIAAASARLRRRDIASSGNLGASV
jgi:HD-GYP domain-containing protein (c-di-GMP phosphodiesterase class II)